MKSSTQRLICTGLAVFLPLAGFSAGLDGLTEKLKKPGVGSLFKKGDSKERELAIYFGVTAGTLITQEIAKKLSKKDQEEVSKSSAKALETNEKQEWANPESGARGSSQVVKTEKRTDNVRIRSSSQVAEVPPLEIIGKSYKTVAATSVYSKADAASPVVATHKPGSTLEITGKVKDADWYFIGENGVGIGFAKIANFSAQPEAPAIKAANPESAGAQAQTVPVDREYKTITQEIVLPDGTVHIEKVTLVKDQSGKWVAAPKTGA